MTPKGAMAYTLAGLFATPLPSGYLTFSEQALASID